jgi:hypothetical protein
MVKHESSAALAAALRGATDLHVIAPAFNNRQFAQFLALAPGVDPVIGALGALAGALPDMLAPTVHVPTRTSIASLHEADAENSMLENLEIGTLARQSAVRADALITAAQNNSCESWAAAALLGPSDASAALLTGSWNTARTVRHWGQSTPDNPTAWMNKLTPAERDRLLATLHTHLADAVYCMPWLHDIHATDIASHIDVLHLSYALAAYAAASPVARDRHATILASLIQRAEPYHLDALTPLAVASHMDEAWTAVVRLLCTHPWNAVHVVTATSWDNIHADVQKTILSAADNDPTSICAAIAFARGEREQMPPITKTHACAFFAAVTPTVWHALPEWARQAWRSELDVQDTHLAVRSLGLDPAFLERAILNNALITAVRRYTPDDAAVRWTLLPLAARNLPITDVPAVINDLPPLPNPIVFVQIAGRMLDLPPMLRDWITDHSMPRALAAIITILRSASPSELPANCCVALAHALTGLTATETETLLAALPDDLRRALRPDVDTLAASAAAEGQTDILAQTLRNWDADNVLPLLALGMLIEENEFVRDWGAATLARHPDMAAALLPLLREELHMALVRHPCITFASADLPLPCPSASARRRQR